MAGAVGFEPTVHDTKNRCLTTWLRPNRLMHISNAPEHNDFMTAVQDCFAVFCEINAKFCKLGLLDNYQ